MTNLHTGLTGTANVTVTEANIAATMKSGSLAVFATPAMCALMEDINFSLSIIKRRSQRSSGGGQRHCRHQPEYYA